MVGHLASVVFGLVILQALMLVPPVHQVFTSVPPPYLGFTTAAELVVSEAMMNCSSSL